MFHSYAGLLERLTTEEKKDPLDAELILDLRATINVIEEDQATALRDFAKLTSLQEITWDLLWALFTPNSLVFNRHEYTEQNRLLLVRRADYCERIDESKYLQVVCDAVSDDGAAFGYSRHYFEIDKYSGARPIAELEVYPLRFRPDKDVVYARAVELGKFYVQMPAHSYHEISGSAMRAGKPMESPVTREIIPRMEKFFVSIHIGACAQADRSSCAHCRHRAVS